MLILDASLELCGQDYQSSSLTASHEMNAFRVEESPWQQNALSSLPSLCDSEDMTSSAAFEKSSASKASSKIQKIFFSLVEVPTVSLKLELAPNPEQFSMREYMLTTDQSPTILFADPRLTK